MVLVALTHKIASAMLTPPKTSGMRLSGNLGAVLVEHLIDDVFFNAKVL